MTPEPREPAAGSLRGPQPAIPAANPARDPGADLAADPLADPAAAPEASLAGEPPAFDPGSSEPAADPDAWSGLPPVTPPPPRGSSGAPSPHRRAGDAEPAGEAEMTFLEHLGELRTVLVHTVLACLVGAMAGWWVAPRVLEDLIRRTVGRAILLSPIEAFNERIKLALLIGLLLVLPYVFYRIWRFVVPGLLRRERSLILPMALGSMVLFAIGFWAAYGYVVPLVVEVLSRFETPSMRAEIRLGALLGFFYNIAIACGLVMQLPLVTMTLTALGVVSPGALLRQWRYALVGVFLTTAIITPGDVVTAQVVMGVPLTALYFASVGLSWLVARRREAAAEGGESV